MMMKTQSKDEYRSSHNSSLGTLSEDPCEGKEPIEMYTESAKKGQSSRLQKPHRVDCVKIQIVQPQHTPFGGCACGCHYEPKYGSNTLPTPPWFPKPPPILSPLTAVAIRVRWRSIQLHQTPKRSPASIMTMVFWGWSIPTRSPATCQSSVTPDFCRQRRNGGSKLGGWDKPWRAVRGTHSKSMAQPRLGATRRAAELR